jgi:hypothetical protein
LFVGQFGLNAARTVDLDAIKKYLQWLTLLAIVCVLMRIAWIFDIVLQVQTAVDIARKKATTDPDVPTTSEKMVTSFAVQVRGIYM